MPYVSVVPIERKTRLILVGVLVLYALSVVAIVYWGLPFLDAYYKSRQIDNVARILVFLAGFWILLPLLPMGAYLCPYGIATARTGRHPPSGWRFIGPARVMDGGSAKVAGVIICACGAAMLVGFVVVIGYFFYVILVR